MRFFSLASQTIWVMASLTASLESLLNHGEQVGLGRPPDDLGSLQPALGKLVSIGPPGNSVGRPLRRVLLLESRPQSAPSSSASPQREGRATTAPKSGCIPCRGLPRIWTSLQRTSSCETADASEGSRRRVAHACLLVRACKDSRQARMWCRRARRRDLVLGCAGLGRGTRGLGFGRRPGRRGTRGKRRGGCGGAR